MDATKIVTKLLRLAAESIESNRVSLDDVDGTEEKTMRHWYSDMIEKGMSIPWEELI